MRHVCETPYTAAWVGDRVLDADHCSSLSCELHSSAVTHPHPHIHTFTPKHPYIHTHSHSHNHTHTFTHPHTITLTQSHPNIHTSTYPHSHSHQHPHPRSLTHIPTQSHPHTTLTHTHTPTRPHTYSHTQTGIGLPLYTSGEEVVQKRRHPRGFCQQYFQRFKRLVRLDLLGGNIQRLSHPSPRCTCATNRTTRGHLVCNRVWQSHASGRTTYHRAELGLKYPAYLRCRSMQLRHTLAAFLPKKMSCVVTNPNVAQPWASQ